MMKKLKQQGARFQKAVSVILFLLCAIPAFANPSPVTTQELSQLLFFPQRDAPATALSLNDARVSAEVSGVLETLTVRVGDTVKRGDTLATIDCQDHEISRREALAAVDAGKAQNRFDQSQLDKAQALSKRGSISVEELDRRRSGAERSSADNDRLAANLQAARRAVEKCAITAPFDAVVVERLTSVGDYLVAGKPVVRLLDRANIEVGAQVQEQDLESLQAAGAVTLTVRDRQYPLRLRAVLPIVDSRVRSREVRLEFSDEPAPPGTAGRIRWSLEQAHVPGDVLVRREQEIGVFLATQGKASFIPLEGAREGQPAPLNHELDDALVIIDGRFGMRDGDPIAIVER
jgi:RND family efflux transporter MFP subunit